MKSSVLYKYLLKHNLLYKYAINAANDSDTLYLLNSQGFKKVLECYGFDAFVWKETKEGIEFWLTHHRQFAREYTEIISIPNKQ